MTHQPLPLTILAVLLLILPVIDSLSKPLSRRNALIGGIASSIVSLPPSWADSPDAIDMEAINAARNKSSKPAILKGQVEQLDLQKITAARSTGSTTRSVVPLTDPPPLLTMRDGIKIPRVGYSLYKTEDQAARCTSLALLAGVRCFDLASQYPASNKEIAKPLKQYLDIGLSGLVASTRDEKPELIQLLIDTSTTGDTHAREIGGASLFSKIAPPPDGSIGRRGRRDGLFVHYKLDNTIVQQDASSVKRAVKTAIKELGCTYLDMVSIHSPLSSPEQRLATYAALLELRNAGFVKSVGVCNYGLSPLKEIQAAGMELPIMNQIEISPFNTHEDIVEWCSSNQVAIGCSAWSRLSSTQSIQDAWLDVVGGIAKAYSITKAQVLVRWSLQKGYTCVPRSSAATKIERMAIAENSYGGMSGFVLSSDEMKRLDGLNVSLKAGTLGRRDGWEDSSVSGADWDPTDIV